MEVIGYAVQISGVFLSASLPGGPEFGFLHLGSSDELQTIKIFPSVHEATKYVCTHVSRHGHTVFLVSLGIGRLIFKQIKEEKGSH